ncbi:MAG: hypothetical protein F6K32_20905 [Desertifilum sp. SIO1I2]|nr:hypothetical protein [Desertifilum sp. SIO1I2]
MIITFIGMSNIGKSYWSKQLTTLGFERFDCDKKIATKLSQQLREPTISLQTIGNWLGFPDTANFQKREAQYLACEAEVMQEAIEYSIENRDRNLVIDTGGSAIYIGEEVFTKLRAFGEIVYLTIPPEVHQTMLQGYLNRPKPLIWNGVFQPMPNEGKHETFSRCYSQLIAQRDRLYENVCTLKLNYNFYRQSSLAAENFLQHIVAKVTE